MTDFHEELSLYLEWLETHPTSSKLLDLIANCYGLERKRKWLFFKESDRDLRIRIVRRFRKLEYSVGYG